MRGLLAGSRVVDVILRGQAQHVSGINLNSSATLNLCRDKGVVADAGKVPYSIASSDGFSPTKSPSRSTTRTGVKGNLIYAAPFGRLLFNAPNNTRCIPLIVRVTLHGFHH